MHAVSCKECRVSSGIQFRTNTPMTAVSTPNGRVSFFAQNFLKVFNGDLVRNLSILSSLQKTRMLRTRSRLLHNSE